MLHVGTLVAVIMVFRKELDKLLRELALMVMELVGNIHLYIHNHKNGKNLSYTKIISSSYRKFVVLILVSMIPTAVLGYTARRLVVKSAVSPLIYGIGFLITGIFLLVVDFGKSGGNKGSATASYADAMWVGICQGISAFPGFSRSGLTISAGLLCGFSRSFAVKYSYLMSIPTIIGAMLYECKDFTASGMTVFAGFTYILGMIAAGVTGYFTIRYLLKIIMKMKFRYFAYYCFAAGIIALAANYLF
jgi:undecaprenyl-diphosphatase